MSVYKLQYPIQYGGETLDSIEIPDRFKVKHLRAMDRSEGEIGKVIELLSELTQVPPSVIGEIDAEDMTELGSIIGDRLGKPPETGVR